MRVRNISAKTVIALFFSCILVNLYGFYAPTVSGLVVGDYILVNFNDRAIGEKAWNEYVGGEVWLNISHFGAPYGVALMGGWPSNCYVFRAASMGGPGWANFTLYRQTSEFNYSVYCETASTPIHNFYQYFKRSNGDNIFYINMYDNDGGACKQGWNVYDHDDNLEASWSIAGCIPAALKQYEVDVTFNYTTSEIHVEIWNTTIDVWFTTSVFDYVNSVNYQFTNGGSQTDLYLDDFRILGQDESEFPVLWDTGADHSGCSPCDYDGQTEYSFAGTNTILFESDYDVFQVGWRITQVTLGLNSSSDLDYATWLRIGDAYQANRTKYYTYGADHYILVWENINLTWTEEIVPLEFKFISTDATDVFYLYYMHSDNDGDGDIQYRYDMNGDRYDGTYNASNIVGRDLCYEIYYDRGSLCGDVNISVYNESNTSQAIVNWSIQIVNKVTNVIEYSASDQNNYLIVNTTDIGLGPRLFIIGADGYYERTYYADIENCINYTLDAYLVNTKYGQWYCFRVISGQEELGQNVPVYDARIDITKFINSTVGYINITTLFTDYNGYAYTYLIPGHRYYFNITRDGYKPSYFNMMMAQNKTDCYEFRLEIITYNPSQWDKWYENISLTVDLDCDTVNSYDDTGNLTVCYEDYNASTIDTDIYIYEVFNNTKTFIATSHNTSNDFCVIFTSLNVTRTHHMVLFYNNTASFIDQISPVTVIVDPCYYYENRTKFSFDERVRNIIGPFIIRPDITGPSYTVGWHVILSIIISFAVLVLLGPYHTGVAIIGSGMALGLTNGIFTLWFTDTFPLLLTTLCPLMVAIGVIYTIRGREIRE